MTVGYTLVMMDGLLAVPLILAAFFYPLQVLALVVVLAVVSLGWIRGLRALAQDGTRHISEAGKA